MLKTVVKRLVSVLLVIAVLFFPVWIVQGESMADTMLDGDVLIGTYLYRNITRGDIVICTIQEDGGSQKVIKRVVAIPGDHLELSAGQLYVNGELQQESYIYEPMNTDDMEMYVPESMYFLLGDNRNNSKDSRYFGCVNDTEILGKALINLSELLR